LNNVGLDRTALRGAIPLAGPMAFMPWKQDRAAFNLTPSDTKPPDDTQPVKVVDGKAPPMLLLQGKDDNTVKPYNAVVLRETIRAAGGKATSILYTHTSHVKIVAAMSRRLAFLVPVLDDIRHFADRMNEMPATTMQSAASP
jgi:acetyl esterase/lipase